MSVVSKGSDQAEFLFCFGEFIILWNHVEIAARDILSWLAGGNIAAQIISNQIGNTSLTDAVRVSASWHPDAQGHLVHFAKTMDLIRAYRNYYVHNLIGVAPEANTGEMIGLVMSLNVKGKYVLHEKALKVGDLHAISVETDNLRKFGLAVLAILRNPDLSERLALFSSLKKPTLPETLSKHVRDPQASASPPRS